MPSSASPPGRRPSSRMVAQPKEGSSHAPVVPLPDDAGWFQITLNQDIEGRHDSSELVD